MEPLAAQPSDPENRLLCAVYIGEKQRRGSTSEAFFCFNSPSGMTKVVFSFLCTRHWSLSLSLSKEKKRTEKEKSIPSLVFLSLPVPQLFPAGTARSFSVFSVSQKYFSETFFFFRLPFIFCPD